MHPECLSDICGAAARLHNFVIDNEGRSYSRVYNYLHAMTLEAQLLARACGKTNIHSLEPEDLAALTTEASALAKVPLAGTNYTVGVDNYHKI